MNLLLLDTGDLIGENLAELSGRRYRHMVEVLKLSVGDECRAGLVDGDIGRGTVREILDGRLILELDLCAVTLPPLPATLILALPRPKVLKRVLQTVATLGVGKLYLINAYKVEKSYWQTPNLRPEVLREQILLGLEQAGTTTLPQIEIRNRFKPFVEDELDSLAGKSQRLVAEPGGSKPVPVALNAAATIVIGPEGGFIPYEIEKLKEQGFTPVSLGPRILRVETAVTAVLSRLYTME